MYPIPVPWRPFYRRVRAALIVTIRFALPIGSFLSTPAAAADDRLIERGHYIALAADCGSCHSTPGAPPFAGGTPLKTPFGAISGPNITPDRDTGIGSWTQADFTRALRQGVRKDGALLYPAMPYTNYTRMSDEDIGALWAYMQNLPAVRNTVPENTFSFPFNIRTGLAVWQGVYFDPARFTPTAGKSESWNRGAYLVEALGHCDACHTPRNAAQATRTRQRLTGAQIEGWYAPDISNDPLSSVSKWNVDQLAAFLKTGHAPGNVKSFGRMQQVIHDSLGKLDDRDIRAIAVYLKDSPANAAPRPQTKVSVPADGQASGKAVYEAHCSNCHQADGRGVPRTVPALAGNTAITAREPYNVVMAVLEGFEPNGSWGVMPSFAAALDDEQIADVSNYIRTTWGNHAQPNATAWTIASWRSAANTPAGAQRVAVVCPNLTDDLLKPALSAGPATLRRASIDHGTLVRVVDRYTAARPKSSSGQVIEALSTAYCRAVVTDGGSQARTDASIADFAQKVAIVLSRNVPAPRAHKTSR